MKIKLHLIKALTLLTIGAGAQIAIPNAGFESWSVVGGSDIPNGWKSISMFPGIHKSTNAHAGTYALKVSVAQYFTGVGGGDLTYNFSFPQTSALPLYYTFWAKVHLNGTDKLHATADLMKSPSSTLITDIPYGFDELTSANNNTAVWTQCTFTMQANGQLPVDSAYLRFQVYPATDTASYVIIDDLAFTGGPSGIQDLNDEQVIESSYPNPASDLHHIVYSISEASNVSLNVYDLLGNVVSSVFSQNQGKGKYKADLDVSGLADGVYQARLLVNGKSHSQKIVVFH